jgi:hypothetical protein
MLNDYMHEIEDKRRYTILPGIRRAHKHCTAIQYILTDMGLQRSSFAELGLLGDSVLVSNLE